MDFNRFWKILIPLLFALAIVLGLLIQRKYDSYLGYKKQTFQFNQDNSSKSLEDYFNQSQNLTQLSQPTRASFFAVGDIMLSRNVANTIKKANDPLLPFSKMTDLLKSADFSFSNLESMFSASDYFNLSGSMVFNTPKANIEGLIDNNFKILNLASNHTLDQGLKGIEFTKEFLDENNIKSIGVGKNLDEAWQPAIIKINGIKIGFIGASYASINDNGKTRNDYVARIEDIEKLKAISYKLKAECDFVVVSMHAGIEYTRMPNQKQINFAHTAIDAGADLVIGHHPHWIQTIEKYKNKYIFYSLGNFIFDQMWSQDTKEGLVLKVQISKTKNQNNQTPNAATLDDLQGTRIPVRLDKIELIPVIIENYSTPRPANEEETKKILEKINQKEKNLY